MKTKANIEYVIRSNKVEDNGISYSYSLIERCSSMMPSYGLPLYSLRVLMTDSDGESTEAMAEDLFRDVNKALSFYDKIVRNLATPIDLAYVIEDEMR